MEQGVFVGRADELAALLEAASAPAAGTAARAVVLTGPAGVGKSRLLHEVVTALPHARFIRMAGFEFGRQVPLSASMPLLRTLMTAGEPGRQLDDALLHGDVAGAAQLEPVRIFELAHRALAALARQCS